VPSTAPIKEKKTNAKRPDISASERKNKLNETNATIKYNDANEMINE
jgi:hypothetical protein